MIPLSVRMTGWMRYRNETLADFNHGTLIAICGENGAGKSSIFDAITFALYGHHRLGKMQASQLISEGCDRLSVEFEFEADGQRYLVRRSRGHKQGERDQSLWVWDGHGEWASVAGTEKEDALDRAIAHIVRLTHEAFTASFLLQQGEATAFIDADPKPRFEIIASLIGLKEYERLEKAARDAARAEKAVLDDITRRLLEAGDVDEDAVVRLREGAAAAERADADAQAVLAAATEMLSGARRFAELSEEVARLDQEIAAAEELLAHKDEIDEQARLHEVMEQTIERVSQIAAALADATRTEAASADSRAKAQAIDVEALAAGHTAAEAAEQNAATEQQVAEKAHAAAVKAERAAYDLAQIAAVILSARADQASFETRLREIDAQLKALSSVGAKIEKDAAAAKKQLDAAEALLEASRREGAEARARAEQLKSELTERKEAAKQAVCSRCGQKIDKAAAKKHVDELTATLAAAVEAAKAATGAENAATKARTAATRDAQAMLDAGTKHARQVSKLEAEHETAAAAKERAATAVAEAEAKLNGRVKDIAAAKAGYDAAKQHLTECEAAVAAARQRVELTRKAAAAARAALDEGRQKRAAFETQAAEAAATAVGQRQKAAAFAAGLGEIGEHALEDASLVLDTLRKNERELADAPVRKRALEAAEKSHTAASAMRSTRQSDIDAIPAAHHVDVGTAREAAREAETAAQQARAEHQRARDALAQAEALLAQAAKLREDKDRLALRQKRLAKLTKLLGKQGLQAQLIRGAITDIKNHANGFLKRLTGGTLELTLDEKKGELVLQAIDHTCMREPRSAKALSGSQKFRCAVAIASGIGQYAGAGGMRSIVIDEGFGSLDADGQRLMVDELKLLAQHMDKVIVVSHLEAFSDPVHFPDRLLVERTEDGGSRIKIAN